VADPEMRAGTFRLVRAWTQHDAAILAHDHQLNRITRRTVRLIWALMASRAAKASSTVACSLWSVACRPLSGPHGLHHAVRPHVATMPQNIAKTRHHSSATRVRVRPSALRILRTSLAEPRVSDPVRMFAFPVAAVNAGRNLMAGTAQSLLPSGGTEGTS
jgi:hypothetical protein